jgi:hypothetical protein
VATTDELPPPIKACACVHERAVVEAQLGECLLAAGGGCLWALQNGVGTFEVSPPGRHQPEVGGGGPLGGGGWGPGAAGDAAPLRPCTH